MQTLLNFRKKLTQLAIPKSLSENHAKPIKRFRSMHKKPIFDTSLAEVMSRQDHKNEVVPIVVRHCVDLLYKNPGWLQTTGLFRISSAASQVEQYKRMYNNLSKDSDCKC